MLIRVEGLLGSDDLIRRDLALRAEERDVGAAARDELVESARCRFQCVLVKPLKRRRAELIGNHTVCCRIEPVELRETGGNVADGEERTRAEIVLGRKRCRAPCQRNDDQRQS